MALHAKKEQVPQRQTVQSGPTGEGSMVVQFVHEFLKEM